MAQIWHTVRIFLNRALDGHPSSSGKASSKAAISGGTSRWTVRHRILHVRFLETVRERRSGDGGGSTEKEGEIVIALGLTATTSDALKAEVELELTSSTSDLFTDEAVVVIEHEPWELSVGKLPRLDEC